MPAFRSLPPLIGLLALLPACALDTDPGGDSAAPVVTITTPVANATVGGQVGITVTAIDATRVDEVRVLIDGVLHSRIFTPPFHANWNTTQFEDNTNHTIRVEALDPFGNRGTAEIVVKVVNGKQ